jgi:hypothetical protein
MNKQKDTSNIPTPTFSYSTWLMFTMLALFTFFCYYHPQSTDYSIFNRSWGFDHLLFYSRPLQYLMLVFLFLLAWPAIQTSLFKLLQKPLHSLGSISIPTKRLILVLSILSVTVFYALRVKYFFLGDFNLRMLQVVKGEMVYTEYLTMQLLYYFTRTGMQLGLEARSCFELFSCLMGGVYVFVSAHIALLLGSNRTSKFILLATQLFTGMILVFCGYIEIYSGPYVALSIFIYCALYYLHHQKRFWAVCLSLGVAIAMHLLCLAAIPALAIVWYFNHPQQLRWLRKWSPVKTAVWLLITGIAGISVVYGIGSGYLLPLFKSPTNSLLVFSKAHFWELWNGEWLACGLFLPLGLLLLTRAVFKKIKLSPNFYFLLTLSGSILLLISLLDLQRGSGDWDIMAITAAPFNLMCARLIFESFDTHKPLTHYLFTVVLGFNVLQTGLWVHTQHSDVSIQKIKSMLVTDPGTYYSARISGRLQLIVLYRLNELEKEAQQEGLLDCYSNLSKDVKACVLYAESIRKQGRQKDVCAFYEDLLSKTPYVPEAYLFLYEYYEKESNEEKQIKNLNQLFDAFSERPDFFLRNINTKPPLYLMFFEILFNAEYKTGNRDRLQKLYLTIQTLKEIVQQGNPKTHG